MPPHINLATALIQRFEGYSSTPYKDVTGTWTIGYGSTKLNGSPVTAKTPPIDKDTALKALSETLSQIDSYLPSHCFEPLTDHQRAAILSLTYNIGLCNFGQSTLLKYLNDGAYGAAAAQFLVWTFSKHIDEPGLHKRREAEMAFFNTKD